MKRSTTSSARGPSPTNTTYSGISNYRTDSYKPVIKNTGNSNFPPLDHRVVARTHFDELSRYLASYLAKEPANSRSSARQKLTRLTRQQFQELSTDVYDELMRRTNNDNEVPFLPVRDDFHPKRNQARQKLATLPTSRFKDLSSDVYFELARRYPDFKEEERRPPSPESTYDDYPSPDFPNMPRQQIPPPSQNTASPLPSRRRPSEDEHGRRGDDLSGQDNYPSRRKPSDANSGFERRSRPSQDTTVGRRSEDRVADREFLTRRPSESVSVTSDATSNVQSATSGIVIPNKSTIAEEDIEVPYGRQVRDSGSTAIDDRERSRERDTDGERDAMSPAMGLSGLSGLSARFKQTDDEESVGGGRNGSVAGGDDYFDKMSFGRASVASDRSASKVGTEDDRLRREYEYKIATMQSKIAGLERDLENADERDKRAVQGEARVRQIEEELAEFRRRAEEHGHAMRALQKELEELREDRARDREREVRRHQEDEDELQILRERCERLEEERDSEKGGNNPQIVEQLRGDMESLMTELSDLSRRNDELMTGKDADLAVIRDLDVQLKEYKRKYEQAKTELRSVKATSQLFLQAPKSDDQLPMSPDGGVLDIHVTAFVSGMDGLLTAGRTNSPTRVLNPMKAVVNAVSAIVEDIRQYERRPRSADVDPDVLRSLRERAEATLSNLVVATKTHATSSGMSPVSLLDAAASHVSSTITEIGKTVFIRKATQAEQEQFSPALVTHSNTSTNSYLPSLRSVEENRPQHGRTASSRRDDFRKPIPPRNVAIDDERRTFSDPSSSDGSSPPPIFDRPSTAGILSDDSAIAEGPEDAWNELKPYLEAQSDSIVIAIQSVLSGVRSPTPPATLNENITQIITIVASIVAVCKDNLPPGSAQQGKEFLRQLSDHANKLSEVQTLPEVTKEARQVMAKSSFAIANIMKSLGKMT